MIELAFVLLIAAPEPQPEPEIRTETMTYAMPPIEVTPEIAPLVDTYYRCAFPDAFGTHQVVAGKEEANTRARIAACGEVRKWAISAAISAYRPQPGGETDAKIFVNRAFDNIDAGQIGLAKTLDNLPLSPGTEVNGNPSPLAEPTRARSPIEVPPEVMPAWATYKRCVEDHFRQRMLSVHNLAEARQAWSASVGDCRDVRARQLAIALETTVDPRIYGDREHARTIIIRAFDRFDAEPNIFVAGKGQ